MLIAWFTVQSLIKLGYSGLDVLLLELSGKSLMYINFWTQVNIWEGLIITNIKVFLFPIFDITKNCT